MPLTYVRVINEQLINRSILIDKIDKSQGNSEGYAQKAKQKIYVPFVNPLDTTVKGYLNLVPTDEVLLSANNGTISGLASAGYITAALVPSFDIAAPAMNPGDGVYDVIGFQTTITSTVATSRFISLYPDVTRVTFRNPGLQTETVSSGSFTLFNNTTIVIPDAALPVLGPPAANWEVQVQANSKLSAWLTLV
jgi:hypothetical protein